MNTFDGRRDERLVIKNRVDEVLSHELVPGIALRFEGNASLVWFGPRVLAVFDVVA